MTRTPRARVGARREQAGIALGLWLDLDVGMHRTGVPPGAEAQRLYRRLATLPGDRAPRACTPTTATCAIAISPARTANVRRGVRAGGGAATGPASTRGLPVPRWSRAARRRSRCMRGATGVELSPGTSVLWDAGYATQLPDLDFLPAALVLTRVVSKPGDHRVCVDLGHKAIASERPHPRVLLVQPSRSTSRRRRACLDAPILDATFVGHSEEHLVFESAAAASLNVGDVLYGIPWHVCPTVALHSEAVVVRDHHAVGSLAHHRARAPPHDLRPRHAASDAARLPLLAALAVVAIVFLIARVRLHAFLSITLVSLALGVGAGMPPATAVRAFQDGVGATLGFIAVVIGLGSIFGKLLAESGAAQVVARRPWSTPSAMRALPWVVAALGFVVGLPVFFSVGLVLLFPIVAGLAASSGRPLLTLALPLVAGLSASHGLVPPHPGPLAAIERLGADTGRTILLRACLCGFPRRSLAARSLFVCCVRCPASAHAGAAGATPS